MQSQSLVIILFLFLLCGANLIIVIMMVRPSAAALLGLFPAKYVPESHLIHNDTTTMTSVNITSLIIAGIEARMAEFEEKWRQGTKKQEQTSGPESQQLPTCESLMQAPDSPLADGAFLTRASTTVSWTLRADGSRELKLPQTCRLKRYTSSQARQCLNKKHISFVGDSLTRYQFVSLAYFIERGEYPPRFGHSLSCSHIDENGKPTCSTPLPNVCMEGDWHDWQAYHSALGGSTDGGIFNGRLQCGCARGKRRNWSEITENALYVSDSGIRLSYLAELGWGDWPPLHGWKFTDCVEKGTCRTTKEDNDRLLARAKARDWDFNEPFYDALINGTLKKILPTVDVAIYNRGIWAVIPEHVAQKLMQPFRDWVGTDGRCFYKSTTAGPGGNKAREPETGYIRQLAFTVGCGFLDFGHLTKEFELLPFSLPLPPKSKNGTISEFRERSDIFWDSVHFVTWVYEELNNIMLNVLCNSEKFE